MEELTDLQEKCFSIIIRYSRQNGGHPPTRRELMNLLSQKSVNGINQILVALKKKGYIRIGPPGKKRNIIVIKEHYRQLALFDGERGASNS